MANKFEKKEWVDRQSQYPSRRKLTATTIENVYEVERAEGDVTEPGNAFDAQNMNNLEDRIYDALGKLDGSDITVLDKTNIFTKTNLEDVLVELFMYASNGKTLIANAIGGSASSTFETLANLAKSIKNDRDNGKTLIANAIGGGAVAKDSFSELAQYIITGKSQIANAVGDTKSGRLSGKESFSAIANFISSNKCSFSADGSTYIMGESFPANNELWEKRINFNFGFTPNRIATIGPYISFNNGNSFIANFGSYISNTPPDQDPERYLIGIKDISSSGFTIWFKVGNRTTNMSLQSGYIYFTAYRIP